MKKAGKKGKNHDHISGRKKRKEKELSMRWELGQKIGGEGLREEG